LDIVHAYELIFESSQMRQTFYELITIGRKTSFCYSPKFALTDQTFSSVIFFDKQKGTVKANLSSQMIENISVQCLTWNMKNQEKKSLETLFEKISTVDIDVLVISLLEVPLSISSVFDQFEKQDYTVVSHVICGNNCLTVITKSLHLPRITTIQYDTKSVSGVNNCYGLIGSIAISFKFNETSFCFVGVHLSEDPKFRKINIMSIMNGLKMGVNNLDVSQFNHLFWLGTFNCELSSDHEETLEYISQNNVKSILLK
jgi:hypothetical protein